MAVSRRRSQARRRALPTCGRVGIHRRRQQTESPHRAARLRYRPPQRPKLQVTMNLKLKVWRQKDAKSEGKLVDIEARNIPEDCSFLEMLDIVNEDLLGKGEEPIAFDHDCREGICGTCSLTIDGVPHGPSETTTCQLYMRKYKDGDTIHIEPFRARPFQVIRDLCVDRTSFDRIQQAGGYITARVGSAPDGNAIPIGKIEADAAMEAAACIQCGACAAA